MPACVDVCVPSKSVPSVDRDYEFIDDDDIYEKTSMDIS